MVTIPEQVQYLNLQRPTNAVYVGTMKFTVESIEAFTDEFLSNIPDVWQNRQLCVSLHRRNIGIMRKEYN